MTCSNLTIHLHAKNRSKLLSYELTVNFKTAFLQRLRQTISKRRDYCRCWLLPVLQSKLS